MRSTISERKEEKQSMFPCLMERTAKTSEGVTIIWTALFIEDNTALMLHCRKDGIEVESDPILIENVKSSDWQRTDKIVTLSN